MTVSCTPSHSDFIVEFQSCKFSSFLKTRRSFAQEDTLTILHNPTRSPKAYINHSCEPNVAFDLSSADHTEWHVRALRQIDAGSPVTFFYLRTEWDTMEQAFETLNAQRSCLCAKFLTREELGGVLERGWASPWILVLINERDVQGDAYK
ncbi:hypothetical protein B0H13DRAFT_2249982 [Mycena leptocephala]|nr:hypothetical protein B0H13DRAFT_2249982 [Mycena leptocephala]